jgi:hypothetical protein
MVFGEAAVELLERHPDGPLPVRRVAERREDGAEQRRRHAQHALHRRRRQANARGAEAAVEQQLGH